MVSKNNRKKQNFMNQVKRHAEQGNYGRGEQLKEAEYNYFVTISDNMKNVDGEDKENLINSFFNEFTAENGERYVRNQIVSRMVDDLLPQAKASAVVIISNILSTDLWTICTDTFSSHVLQSAIIQSIKLLQPNYVEEDVPLSDEQKEKLSDFLFKVTKYCYNNFLDFVTEKYASHVVRTLMEVSSGMAPNSSLNNNSSQQRKGMSSTVTRVVPEKLNGLATEMCQRLTMVPKLTDVISSECGSAVFQCGLAVAKHLGDSDLCSSLTEHILTHGIKELYSEEEGEGVIPAVFQYNATCRLLEVVTDCCSTDQIQTIYDSYFSGNISRLVQHNMANFSVQRLLRAWSDAETFEPLSEGICEAVEYIMTANYTGVLLAWCEACVKLHSQQGKCATTLMSAFFCYEPEERQMQFVPALIQMTPFDQIKIKGKVSLHGALIVQQLLKFSKPIRIVNSLLSMSTEELTFVLTDPRGCHITDSFCGSVSVGEKSRAKLVTKVQDQAVILATSKHGSRSLEALWSVAQPQSRIAMCQKLSDSTAVMKGNEYGAILYSKFNVHMFSKKDKEDWLNLEQRKSEKRKALQSSWNALQQQGPPMKKKKKSKHSSEDDE